jgi:hypothetical protein
MQTAQEAIEFFKQWKAYTIEALAILAPNCDPTQTIKTRPWLQDGPMGVIYHYTGGPDGLASTRWANENPANTGSSWHCTILDHVIAAVEELTKKYPLVRRYLPTTAFFIATLEESTWHGNWTNNRCFGIENRNLGKLNAKGYRGKYKSINPPVQINGLWWESYTKGQLLGNIFVARALRLIQESKGQLFLPTWNLPHSAIWGIGTDKNDVGLTFPMYNVRASVFMSTFAEEPAWLSAYHDHTIVDVVDGESFDEEMADLARDCAPPPMEEPDPDVSNEKKMQWRGYLPWVRWALEKLGYHIEHPQSFTTLDNATKDAATIFQHSTHAPGWVGKYGALKIDGIPGTNTIKGIMHALDQFKIEYTNPLGE